MAQNCDKNLFIYFYQHKRVRETLSKASLILPRNNLIQLPIVLDYDYKNAL